MGGYRVTVGPRTVLALGLTAIVVAALARHRLATSRYPVDVGAALRGAAHTADATIPAALLTWMIVGVALFALAGWLRRRQTDLTASEAIGGAVVLLWGGSYLALLTLGPLGLYRPFVLRGLLLGLVFSTLRLSGWRGPRRRWPRGAWLAASAAALSVGPLLFLQLASPVSPFMDVLPYVASTQKIVTFGFYDAFGNDAAGVWAPSRQVAGCDAPFSFLALVAGLPAHLVITSLIVPFAVLQVVSLYMVGRSVSGSLAGGMATLFLLQTFLWRRTPDMRSTGLAFFLVAIGLVFILNARRDGARTALGGLALGVATTVSPLIGATGMQVAAISTLLAWIDFRRSPLPALIALAAGSIFAGPQVLIGLALLVPLWVLPAAAGCGVALILAVSRLTPVLGRPRSRPLPYARVAAIVALPLTALFLNAGRQSDFFNGNWFGYAPLAFVALGGLAFLAHGVWRRPHRWPAAALPAVALWVGFANYALASPYRFQGDLELRSVMGEVTVKMEYYWWPYWMALAAGVWFAMLARRWAFGPAVALVLLLVIYPVRYITEQPPDFHGAQLSVAETWGFHLTNAAEGYHAGHPDRRWVLDANWRTLARLLLDEVAAGRLTYYTHVVHVAPSTNSVGVPLWTGISIDLYTPQYNADNLWNVGSRIRDLDALPAAFAARPRYVIIEGLPPSQFPQLADYDEVFAAPGVHLYFMRG